MSKLVCDIRHFHRINSVPTALRKWFNTIIIGYLTHHVAWNHQRTIICIMWWVTTDVAVSVCGRSGLWPFRFVAVPVCGRFGLWPFRLVAVSVCVLSGLWPFRFVAFRIVTVLAVAVSVCGRYDLLPAGRPHECVVARPTTAPDAGVNLNTVIWTLMIFQHQEQYQESIEFPPAKLNSIIGTPNPAGKHNYFVDIFNWIFVKFCISSTFCWCLFPGAY